jgi:hypothetical protein
MEISAYLAVAMLIGIAVFQLALAAGAPLGRAAWGGQHHGTLPAGFRVASGVAGRVVYPAIVAVVLATAGVVDGGWAPGDGRVVMWVLTVFFGVGTLANAASRSRPERIWAPVSLAIAICCAIIALSI